MDLSPPPATTATTTTTTTAVKTPDAETETPTRIQSNSLQKHLPPPPLTNGLLKRHNHKPLHHHPPPAYKECLKNHAATMGGHAVDGCGEFMPSPTSTPTHPTSLKCAACGCHRNFHRRDPDESASSSPHHHHPPIQHVIEYQPHHRHHPPPPQPHGTGPGGSPPNSPSPPPISSSYYPSAPHMLLALSAGLAENHHAAAGGSGSKSNPHGKKRFRTKFTQNQKEKMQEFAERLGWKMQKRDEEMILGFCTQIGVEKGVFKVWMHNNKVNKKEFAGNGGSSGGVFDLFSAGNGLENGGAGSLQHHNNDSVSTGGNVNGSSSSS